MRADQRTARNGTINRMLGAELRRAREAAGLTRAQLISRMATEIHPQTLASYEHGIRQCSIPRLAELCAALGIDAPDLLALALHRAGAAPVPGALRVDLGALLRDRTAAFDPVRTWARNRLADAPGGADQPDVVRVERVAVRELAFVVGVPAPDLVTYLTMFAPLPAGRR